MKMTLPLGFLLKFPQKEICSLFHFGDEGIICIKKIMDEIV